MAFLTSILLKGFTAVFTKLMITLASEKMVEFAFFQVAEAVSKSTATTHDDEWVAKIKELYFKN